MFSLIKRIKIKNPKVNLQDARGCFLYDFKGGGISKKRYEQWLNGKIMDVYEYTGRFGSSKKSEAVRLAEKAYSQLLLPYLRGGNYEALAFLMHKECEYCDNPIVYGREGKCALPESARNKMRSIRLLGLEMPNFRLASFGANVVCIVYKRKVVRKH